MAFKRGLGKNNCDYGMRDIYREYRKQSKNFVDRSTFSKILNEYNERIMTAMIYENLIFKMPYRLGEVRIQRRRMTPYVKDGEVVKSHIMPDWKATLDYWREQYPDLTDEEIKQIPGKKVLRHLNKHTNGYSARFFWDKNYSNAINQSCYIFKATRTAKEELARLLKKIGRITYFE